MGISMKKWYKGDTHLHTTNSDGAMSVDTLISECKKIGLEYMIITDHNYNSVEKSYYDGDMLVIQGQELTHENGHVNVWGEKVPHEPPHQLETADDYADIIAKCKEAGAKRALVLPVGGAFHSPLMEPARLRLSRLLKVIKLEYRGGRFSVPFLTT